MNAAFAIAKNLGIIGWATPTIIYSSIFLALAGCSFGATNSIRCNFAASTSSFCELSKSHHRHKKDYPD